jgi:hypothetical protein
MSVSRQRQVEVGGDWLGPIVELRSDRETLVILVGAVLVRA